MKICNITMIGYTNFGNRLQNYAIRNFIKNEFNYDIYTLWHVNIFDLIKNNFKMIIPSKYKEYKRFKNFYIFNRKHIKRYNFKADKFIYSKDINKFDFFIVGSDQVWNCDYFIKFPKDGGADLFLLNNIPKYKCIAFAPSFGTSKINQNYKEIYKNALLKFKAMSVRENDGKKIVENLTGRNDIEVLVDPTMLLTNEEWNKVTKQPKQYKGEKYILNYFLGELSRERRKEIERIANEKNYKIINILDKNDSYYVSGPSEFLWLEKHAELICTDSFHSSVFAILYDRPFVVFDREEKGMDNMGSRLDTLIDKFKLKNRRYNGKNITKENLEHDYTEAYKILVEERKKSDAFLRNALEIK